jgi:hypothetical protein
MAAAAAPAPIYLQQIYAPSAVEIENRIDEYVKDVLSQFVYNNVEQIPMRRNPEYEENKPIIINGESPITLGYNTVYKVFEDHFNAIILDYPHIIPIIKDKIKRNISRYISPPTSFGLCEIYPGSRYRPEKLAIDLVPHQTNSCKKFILQDLNNYFNEYIKVSIEFMKNHCMDELRKPDLTYLKSIKICYGMSIIYQLMYNMFQREGGNYKYLTQLLSTLPRGPPDHPTGFEASRQFLASAIVETYIQSTNQYYILFELQGVPDMLDISQGKLYEIKSSEEGCRQHEATKQIKPRSDYRSLIQNNEFKLILGSHKTVSDNCIYEKYNGPSSVRTYYIMNTKNITKLTATKDWSDIIDALLDLKTTFLERSRITLIPGIGNMYLDFADSHLVNFYTNLNERNIGINNAENREYIKLSSPEARKARVTQLIVEEERKRQDIRRAEEQRKAAASSADNADKINRSILLLKQSVEKTLLQRTFDETIDGTIKKENLDNLLAERYINAELHKVLLKLIVVKPNKYLDETNIIDLQTYIKTIDELIKKYKKIIKQKLNDLKIDNYKKQIDEAIDSMRMRIKNLKMIFIKLSDMKERKARNNTPKQFVMQQRGEMPPGAAAAAASRPADADSRKRKAEGPPGLQKYLKYKAKYLQLKNLMKSLNLQ